MNRFKENILFKEAPFIQKLFYKIYYKTIKRDKKRKSFTLEGAKLMRKKA